MPQDVARLIAELLSDDGYVSGRRRYPRSVSAEDAAAVAEITHAEVDRGTAARAEAAAADGVVLACGRGCNYCCEETVMVYEAEALLIARWLTRDEHARERAAFLAAYPAWRAAAGDTPDRLAELISLADVEGYRAAHIEAWRRRLLCAFNAGGDCTIYPVRPTNCRNAHAVDTAELCRGDHGGSKVATRLSFVPLDEFLSKVRKLERATHHAVGGARRRPQALCDAVARLLGARP